MTERLPFVFKEKPFWILILLGLLFFYRPLFGGETLYFRDLTSLHLLQKQRLVEFIHQHELPLWDPYIQGGQSYIGHITGNPLYPSNILYFFLPLFTAFNFDLVLHLILCSLAAYALARVLGLNTLSSFLVGIIYGYCGHTLSKMNFYFRLLVLPYLPLLILFWHLYLSQKRTRWFVLAVVSGALQLFAGALEVVALHFAILLGWTFFYPYSQRTIERLKHYALVAIFSFGIASVQLFPAAEVIAQSHRPQGFSYSFFTQWSLHPQRLAELIVPEFLGFRDTLDQRTYWGRNIEDGATPFILSIYFGFPVLFLAIGSVFYRETNSILPRRVRLYLFCLIIAGILLALGRFLPGFYWLYKLLPMFRAIRYPVKFLNLTVLPVSLLAGYGAEKCTSSFAKHPIWLIAAPIFLCSIAFYFLPNFAVSFQRFFFDQTNEFARIGLARSFLHASMVSLALLLLYQYGRARPEKSILWGLIAIIAADLFFAGYAVNFTAPRKLLELQSPLAPQIKAELHGGSLYRVPVWRATVQAPSNDLVWGYRWDMDVLNKSTAAFFQIPLVFNDDLDGLATDRMLQLKSKMESLPWPQKLPILSSAGVRLILSQEELTLPGVEQLPISNPGKTILYLYRNAAAQPVYFNPRGTNCDAAQIKVQDARNNRSSYLVTTKCDGDLVISDAYFPGWRLYVDDRRIPLVQANHAFSAGFIKAGSHRVEKIYRPFSLWLGTAVSILSLFALLIAAKRLA